jgi:uncharacterized protein (DUF58 family)
MPEPEPAIVDQRFLAAARRLRLRALGLTPHPQRAERPTPIAGSGTDYRDRRPYVPGDEPRRIDWSLYRRSGRLFIRLYDEPRRLGVTILVDCSGSMGFERPPRLRAAKQVAIALAAAALEEGQKVTVRPIAGGRLRDPVGSADSPAGLGRLAIGVGRAAATAAPSELAGVFEAVRRLREPRGQLVVVSDFFDPGGVEAWRPALHATPHVPLLVQLARASDGEPRVEGDVEIEDCETGELVRVSGSPRTAAAYRAAYERFESALHDAAVGGGGRRLRLDADRPVLEQLGRASIGGEIRVGRAIGGRR